MFHTISVVYNTALYQPLLNGLIWLYTVLPGHDLGVAIIVFTVIIRLLLAPLLWKAQQSQKDLARIQPEVKRIQEQHKSDKEAQGRAMMELYQKHKVNPFSGCLIMLVQIPILIALFKVFQQGLTTAELGMLYSFIPHPGTLNSISFGFLNLAKGNLVLGIFAAISQYFQLKMTMPAQPATVQKDDFSRIMQTQSLYIFPVLILVWSYKLPAALTLYWTVLNIFGILQEIIMRRREKAPEIKGA